MKRGSIGMVVVSTLFVVLVLSLVEYLIPDRSSIVFIGIAGLSALVGGLIGTKLFPNNADQ
ncbi:hypothetical protein ACXYMX_16860 [Sporosarcina sp. CAU 1771]